jgi:hypothetical protein
MPRTTFNEATGETAVLDGGQWKIASRVAASKDGRKAYLIGDRWLTDDAPEPMPSFEDAKSGVNTGRTGLLPAIATPADLAAHYGSALIAKPVSDIAGMTGAAIDYLRGESTNRPAGFQEDVRKRLTYAPRGQLSEDIAASPYNPINMIGNVLTAGGRGAASLVPGDSLSSEVARNAIREAVPQVAGIYGPQAIAAGSRALPNVRIPNILQSAETRAGRLLTDLADNAGAGKSPAVIAALENAKPSVPGEQMTAGLAAVDAMSPEFAAMQGIVNRRAPGKYGTGGIQSGNEAARVAALKSVQPEIVFEKSARAALSDPLYKKARAAGDVVDTQPIIQSIDSIIDRNVANPALVRALAEVRIGLEKAGSNAERVASAIDGIKTLKANKDNAFIRGHLDDIQKALENAVPGYSEAQQTFARASQPVNQSNVIQALLNKLEKPVTGQNLNAFTDVLGKGEGAMLKRSTGFPRYQDGDLPKILNPDQLKAVNGVDSSVQRNAIFDRLASDGQSAATRIIGMETPKVPPTGILNPKLTMTRSIVNRFIGKIDNGTIDYLVKNMDNPAKIAEAMRGAPLVQRKHMSDFVKQYGAFVGYNTQGDE